MPSPTTAATQRTSPWPSLCVFALCLGALLLVLFARSFDPDLVLFSNDGPLAAISSEKALIPAAFTGIWEDLNWVGFAGISAAPSMTAIVSWCTNPVGFSKVYLPVSLMLLGLSAWLFCRVMRFSSITCLLVGLAAALNMNVFSNGCWGLATRALTLASAFAALAALQSGMARRPFLKAILAGFCVGMAVMEGFDVGAIFSVYVAAFAFFLALTREGTSIGGKVGRGLGVVAVMAACAAFIAAYTLNVLITTQIEGVAGTNQDEKSREERYGYATQWSLPKVETLRVIIPGLFGYRMTDPNEQPYDGSYWGTVGRTPNWRPEVPGLPRHSGSGEYAGLLVVMLAIWAVIQSFRKKLSPFTEFEKKCVWFWTTLALVSLVLAFGRHTPFYRLVYALPYSSLIRNPIKFMHPFHMALLVLFAYGLQDLVKRYLENPKEKVTSLFDQVGTWWRTSTGFEKQWTWGCLGVLAFSLLGWLIFSAARKDTAAYLTKDGYPDPALADSIVRFSMMEIGWYIFFLILSTLFVTCILSGAFAGRRAKVAGFLLGLLLVVDLSRANSFWIVYEKYKEKLATNLIIDTLREKRTEYRVTASIPIKDQQNFYAFYHNIWLQHHFQYYNIESLDLPQMRSPPEDLVRYENTFSGSAPLYTRRWELTSTRYVLCWLGMLDTLNKQFDAGKERFKLHTAFDIAQDPRGVVTTITNAPNMRFALMEFTGALPRAKLYSNWQATDTNTVLATLASPAFDPAKSVLVTDKLAPPIPENATKDPGTVETKEYTPRYRKLAAQANVPALLLLNDRLAPYWNAWVDGKPEPILRCNFMMRGVPLTPGKHEVEFRFQPPTTFLKVSVAAIALGLLLCAFLAVDGKMNPLVEVAVSPAPIPATAAETANPGAQSKKSKK